MIRPTANERGTSLIEALVAMTVLGIVAVAVFGLFLTGQTAIGGARGLEQASLLAQQRMERIKAAASCNVVPRSQPRELVDEANFPGYAVEVESVAHAPDLHLITVTVYWKDADRDRQVSLMTYVRTTDERL